jgi:hypothetical protein
MTCFDRTLHRAVFDSLPIPWSPRVPRERLISIPFLDLSLQSDLTMQGSPLVRVHDIENVEYTPHSLREYAHPIFIVGWALSLGRELEHLCHALSATSFGGADSFCSSTRDEGQTEFEGSGILVISSLELGASG